MSDSEVFTSIFLPVPIPTHSNVQTESRGAVSPVGADTQPWSDSPLAANSILAATCHGHALMLPTVSQEIIHFFPL